MAKADTTPNEEPVPTTIKKFLNKKSITIASAVVGTLAVAATTVALKARNAQSSFTVEEPDSIEE